MQYNSNPPPAIIRVCPHINNSVFTPNSDCNKLTIGDINKNTYTQGLLDCAQEALDRIRRDNNGTAGTVNSSAIASGVTTTTLGTDNLNE